MKTIALIGRPNVGKSSLFNILTKTRNALVSDFYGLTRDRQYGRFNINETCYFLIDTGGIETANKDLIYKKMSLQTDLAIDESDILFFMVDGRESLNSIDEEIALKLRKKNKPTLLIINKTEGLDKSLLLNDFKKLGFKNNLMISAAHREGISLINDFLSSYQYENFSQEVTNNKLKLSILGKPNVGKSTLINSILGQERFISFDEPGTTRDSNSVDFLYKDRELSIIDTAGIRKKGKVYEKIEKFSILKSLLSIDNSDICVLIIDASEGLTSQDLQIFGYIIDAGKPLVIGINKWDLIDSYNKNLIKESIDKKINFLSNFEMFFISALKKQGINPMLDATLRAYNASIKKIKTPLLNKFISDLQQSHQPAIYQGIRPKLKYIHQGGICPPTFIVHGNHLNGIKNDYLRFIQSSISKAFNFIGTPIQIQLKETNNPYEKSEKKPKKIGLVTRRREINKKRNHLKKNKDF